MTQSNIESSTTSKMTGYYYAHPASPTISVLMDPDEDVQEYMESQGWVLVETRVHWIH